MKTVIVPKVVKEIQEKVRLFFIDFDEPELHITAKQIAVHMLNNQYSSHYILRECKTYLNVNIERTLKTCTYKYLVKTAVETEKQIGRPLIFKREDFLNVINQ